MLVRLCLSAATMFPNQVILQSGSGPTQPSLPSQPFQTLGNITADSRTADLQTLGPVFLSDSGLYFYIGPIFTACLYLSVAGLMRNQADSAGQKLMSFPLVFFGSGLTANAQKASVEL